MCKNTHLKKVNFHLEFSINGAGEGDFVTGTVILDNLTLTGYGGIDLVIFNGMNTPPAWGAPFSWGGAQMSVTEGGGYTEETNALTYIQEDVWSGGGFNMTPAVDLSSGGEWLSLTRRSLQTGTRLQCA